MKFLQSYFTDIGIKRKSNQDSVGIYKAETDLGEVLLVVLADGMGGYQHGELASKTCVLQMEQWFKHTLPDIIYSGYNEEIIKSSMEDEVLKCNARLYNYGKDNEIELGSTLTAFLFIQDNYYAVHVGDSRGYIIDTGLHQITRDHSLIAQELEQGLITKEEAKTDKRVNILLECVGITPEITMDFFTGKIKNKNTFVICCDGFWHKLTEDEYVRYLSGEMINNNKTMRMHLNLLVDTVKLRGEKDNISVIGVTAIE